MRCAGSIFKNLHVKNLPAEAAAEVPPEAIRDGKVASAYFLERVGAKGIRRGGIEIASYHANLIYNTGDGTADDLRGLIVELKNRVRERFGFEVEEEVQYVGEFGPLPDATISAK
jgi:UDP-N-acetylmuramate dehydrogenase